MSKVGNALIRADGQATVVCRSYFRECFEYARGELGRHPQVELVSTSVAPVVSSFVIGVLTGVAWSSLLYGVISGVIAGILTLVFTWITIFCIYFAQSPSVLYGRSLETSNNLNDTLLAARNRNRELELARKEDAKEILSQRSQKEAVLEELSRIREENTSLRAELESWKKYNVVFNVDESKSKISLANNGLLRLTLMIRFENRDVNNWSLKALDYTLHEKTDEGFADVFTMVKIQYALNGQEIKKADFERMVIQGGVVTDYYEAVVDLHILSQNFEGFESLGYSHFVRITMEVNNQEPYVQEYIFSSLNIDRNHGTLFNLENPQVHWERKFRHLN